MAAFSHPSSSRRSEIAPKTHSTRSSKSGRPQVARSEAERRAEPRGA
eukprot:CAMPEP_0179860332 /NCGR_PEP_ID=MMETSP0982-20121206/13565_1 /TAXON_ID=483367 /ORGANISM="non described non described, Strain CCMP 2436" /LENGTH=46 /DNA_ID= /DNA_START= /DNA_END= /DNA_ORIENTATION=